MSKVHVVLQNGAVMFVVDSKEKVRDNIRAAMMEEKHIVVLDSDDTPSTITVDNFVELMYDLGTIGSYAIVTSVEMLEEGDEVATYSAFECNVG